MTEDDYNDIVVRAWAFIVGQRPMTNAQAHEIATRLLFGSLMKLAGNDRHKAAALSKETLRDLALAILDPDTELVESKPKGGDASEVVEAAGPAEESTPARASNRTRRPRRQVH